MHNFNSKTVFKLFFFASFGCCKIITLKLNLSFCFGKAIHRHELTGFVQNSHFLRFLLLNSMTFKSIHLLPNFLSLANCLSGPLKLLEIVQVQGHHAEGVGKYFIIVSSSSRRINIINNNIFY